MTKLPSGLSCAFIKQRGRSHVISMGSVRPWKAIQSSLPSGEREKGVVSRAEDVLPALSRGGRFFPQIGVVQVVLYSRREIRAVPRSRAWNRRCWPKSKIHLAALFDKTAALINSAGVKLPRIFGLADYLPAFARLSSKGYPFSQCKPCSFRRR